MRSVVLYTRDGCTLCRHAKKVIIGVRREIEFAFSEVDIGWEGDLYDLYKFDIPVVEIDGKRAFKHRVDPDALKARLTK